MQGEGEWAEGPEEGGVARCYAARCCAELAGDGGMHQALLKSGLADALAERAAALVSLGLRVQVSSCDLKYVLAHAYGPASV